MAHQIDQSNINLESANTVNSEIVDPANGDLVPRTANYLEDASVPAMDSKLILEGGLQNRQ